MADTTKAKRDRYMSTNQKNYLAASEQLVDMEIEAGELECRRFHLSRELSDVERKLEQIRAKLVTQKALVVCYTNGEDIVAAKLRLGGDED